MQEKAKENEMRKNLKGRTSDDLTRYVFKRSIIYSSFSLTFWELHVRLLAKMTEGSIWSLSLIISFPGISFPNLKFTTWETCNLSHAKVYEENKGQIAQRKVFVVFCTKNTFYASYALELFYLHCLKLFPISGQWTFDCFFILPQTILRCLG